MLKVMTIVGTRPELIRLSRVIAKLDQYCQHTLVHTGQNFDYELNAVFFEELDIRPPDVFLNAAGSSAIETIANVLLNIDPVLERLKPDAVLILGDTNSALAAIAAKRRKIRFFTVKQGIVVLISAYPKKSIVKLWITLLIFICLIVILLEVIYYVKA